MPLFSLSVAALAASLLAVPNGWTFKADVVSKKGAHANAALHVEGAPGGDHYEIWRNGSGVAFDKLFVLRMRPDFTEVWRTEIRAPGAPDLFATVPTAVTDANGDLVFTTIGANLNRYSKDTRLHKVEQDGDIAFDHEIGQAYKGKRIDGMLALDDGDVLVTGLLTGEAFLRRYSPTGTLVYENEYGTQGYVSEMASDASGRVYIAGKLDGKLKLLALDADGAERWETMPSLGQSVVPRIVDLHVAATGRISMTAQLRSTTSAPGSVSVWRYAPESNRATHYFNVKTPGRNDFSGGDRVVVGHPAHGDEVFLAWTDERDKSAFVAKVRPKATPAASGRVSTVRRKPRAMVRVRGRATAQDPVGWQTKIAVQRLRTLEVLSGGRVVVFGTHEAGPAGFGTTIEARALTKTGVLVGGQTVPSGQHNLDNVNLADVYAHGNRLFAVGRDFGEHPQGAVRVRYSFHKVGAKSSAKAARARPVPRQSARAAKARPKAKASAARAKAR